MAKERRIFQRWLKRVMVAYTTFSGGQATEYAATEDVSAGGLQLILSHKLKVDEPIEIKIELVNDSIPISALCKVTHIKEEGSKYRTGLQFQNLDDFQKERLLKHLKENR